MQPSIINLHQESLQEDLNLFNHFIKQQRWGNSMFAFIPQQKRCSGESVQVVRKITNMVLNSNIELLPLISDINMYPRLVLKNGSNKLALINMKTLAVLKKKMVGNKFFSTEHDAEYRFTAVFLMETKALLDMSATNQIETLHMTPNQFIQVAERTMQINMKIFDRSNQMNNVFEYFHIQFTERYSKLSNFHKLRINLMENLASIIGKHTIDLGLHGFEECNNTF